MVHAQKPYFVFRRNGRVHLNRRGRQFSRPLAAEVCASAVVMVDTLCSEVVWRVLATHCIRQFPLHFPSRASPCAITFQLESNRYITSQTARFVYTSRKPSCYYISATKTCLKKMYAYEGRDSILRNLHLILGFFLFFTFVVAHHSVTSCCIN